MLAGLSGPHPRATGPDHQRPSDPITPQGGRDHPSSIRTRPRPLGPLVRFAGHALIPVLCGWAKIPAIEPQRMSSLYLYFDPGGGGVGWRRAITGFGST
jgi:hypothetical protein